MNRLSPDPYPGAPKILFVGMGESSHTQSWINLFADAQLNVRLFSMPLGAPPDAWPVRTYATCLPPVTAGAPGTRKNLYPSGMVGQALRRYVARFGPHGESNIASRWLARIIRAWRPDVIQSIGLRHASYFVHYVRTTYGVGDVGAWVIQDWGPDLTMQRYIPDYNAKIREVIAACDGYVTDNDYNFSVARELGLAAEKVSPAGWVLASGGLDVDALGKLAPLPPSRRERVILWPKAYNCPQAVAYPVFEAFRLCWDRIQPCSVQLLAVIQEEVGMWFEALPNHIKKQCAVHGRIDRDRFLGMLGGARVMLAPSLSDGMPNVLSEAMAMGTVPIVSPLASITPHVDTAHTLFARNLYPDEIAGALVKAMGDDAFADAAARANIALARQTVDRAMTRRTMIAYYTELAGRVSRPSASGRRA